MKHEERQMKRNDNYIWLEDVLDSRCLSWAKDENENTTKALPSGFIPSPKIIGNT